MRSSSGLPVDRRHDVSEDLYDYLPAARTIIESAVMSATSEMCAQPNICTHWQLHCTKMSGVS